MKKLFVLLLVFFVFLKAVKSQFLKPNSLLKANKITFKVDDLSSSKVASNSISIYNKANTFAGKTPKVWLDERLIVGKAAKGSVLAAFTQTFSDTRLKELINEHGLNITLYLTPTGKVAEVIYQVQKNSTLTGVELESLEIALKRNVTYNLDQNLTKNGDFFIANFRVVYNSILNRQIQDY